MVVQTCHVSIVTGDHNVICCNDESTCSVVADLDVLPM